MSTKVIQHAEHDMTELLHRFAVFIHSSVFPHRDKSRVGTCLTGVFPCDELKCGKHLRRGR